MLEKLLEWLLIFSPTLKRSESSGEETSNPSKKERKHLDYLNYDIIYTFVGLGENN